MKICVQLRFIVNNDLPVGFLKQNFKNIFRGRVCRLLASKVEMNRYLIENQQDQKCQLISRRFSTTLGTTVDNHKTRNGTFGDRSLQCHTLIVSYSCTSPHGSNWKTHELKCHNQQHLRPNLIFTTRCCELGSSSGSVKLANAVTHSEIFSNMREIQMEV